MGKNARQIALEILVRMYRDAAYSNLTLDAALRRNALSGRDAALVSALVYGVQERLYTIDYQLSLYLKQPLKKLKPEVIAALRLGVCQLLFMDKIPPSAAVSESVSLVRNNGCAFASGLVNAVLHKVADAGLCLPEAQESETAALSIQYSIPEWLIAKWQEAYGQCEMRAILEACTAPAPMTVRVNTLRTTAKELISVFAQDKISACISTEIEDALILTRAGAIERTDAYQKGLFHVQDAASQLCCKALEAQPGETVFDLCAAPGGKSFTVAEQMRGKGKLCSFDLYSSRTALIEEGAERLGISMIQAAVADAACFNVSLGKADRVLCDVPCSGFGILRRKPEIRYKARGEVDKLPDLQYLILRNAARYVREGGRLLYSTCTLNPDENEAVCLRFLQEHPNFRPVQALPALSEGRRDENGFFTLFPQSGGHDGFYIAVFQEVSV